jgi:hypothetical protein
MGLPTSRSVQVQASGVCSAFINQHGMIMWVVCAKHDHGISAWLAAAHGSSNVLYSAVLAT